MKTIISIIFCVCVSVSAGAQNTMREAWFSMPDSLCLYLNKNLRTELVDFVDMGVKAEVKNLMNSVSVMDTLTADYTRVSLSEALTIELKLLPKADADTVICMVKTYNGPAKESLVSFYDSAWNPIANDFGLTGMKSISQTDSSMIDSFVQCPDTLSNIEFEKRKKLIDPVMVYAELSPNDYSISFSLSMPLTTSEEQEQLKPIILQRKYKWEQGMFNKF